MVNHPFGMQTDADYRYLTILSLQDLEDWRKSYSLVRTAEERKACVQHFRRMLTATRIYRKYMRPLP